MSAVVNISNVTKTFGDKEVISGVNMRIAKGEIYGFLGPNGAGKTTVMRMIMNLVKPTTGDIECFGEKLTAASYEVLKRIGSIVEYPVFYDRLSAMENMELHCEYMGYYNKKAIKEAMELVRLEDTGRKKVRDFSLGMKQRLGIARAIVTKPELLLFDEPINGLDPVAIKEMRNLFLMLSREYGMTLLVSSHILGEIEQIADTVGVISKGRIVEQVSMDNIRQTAMEYVEITTRDEKNLAFILEHHLEMTNFKIAGERTVRIYDLTCPLEHLLKRLILHGASIDEIHRKSHTLEDYFLKLIQEGGTVHA